jgi:hypothetical protein
LCFFPLRFRSEQPPLLIAEEVIERIRASPPSDEEYFLMTFFGFLIVGFYFLGKVARRIRT